MDCGDCGRKLIVISGNNGFLIYCPVCHPDLDKAWCLGKLLPSWLKKPEKKS